MAGAWDTGRMGEVVAGMVVVAGRRPQSSGACRRGRRAQRLFVVALAAGIVGSGGLAGVALCGAAALEHDLPGTRACRESVARTWEVFALSMIGLCAVLFATALVAAALDYRRWPVPRPTRRGRGRSRSVASAG